MAAVNLNITSQRTIPGDIAAFLETNIQEHLDGLGDVDTYKVRHYAGEFLAEDNLNRLMADVSQFPHILYDMEVIEEIDVDDTQTSPEDNFGFIIFCCHSNVFDESIQWRSSYELAWDVRTAFQGVEFQSTGKLVANGYFIPRSIERELHIPGMSVHTLRVETQIIHDVKGSV